jgi:hypothetical protein
MTSLIKNGHLKLSVYSVSYYNWAATLLIASSMIVFLGLSKKTYVDHIILRRRIESLLMIDLAVTPIVMNPQ